MADKYGSILNPYYIIYTGPTSSNNVNDVNTNIRFYRAALGSTGYMFCNFTDLEFVSVHENTEKTKNLAKNNT